MKKRKVTEFSWLKFKESSKRSYSTKPEKKFKGVFNYYGEIHQVETIAVSLLQAFNLMIWTLAKRLKVSRILIWNYFNETDKYKIKEVV